MTEERLTEITNDIRAGLYHNREEWGEEKTEKTMLELIDAVHQLNNELEAVRLELSYHLVDC